MKTAMMTIDFNGNRFKPQMNAALTDGYCFLYDIQRSFVEHAGETISTEAALRLVNEAVSLATTSTADTPRSSFNLFLAATKLLTASAINIETLEADGWLPGNSEFPYQGEACYRKAISVVLDDGREYYASFTPEEEDSIDLWLWDTLEGDWSNTQTIPKDSIFLWKYANEREAPLLQDIVTCVHEEGESRYDDE